MPEPTEMPPPKQAEAQKAVWAAPHITHIDMSRTLGPRLSP